MVAEGPFDGGGIASFIFFFELSIFYFQQTNLLRSFFFSMNRSEQL
jgi:hypothetical protein